MVRGFFLLSLTIVVAVHAASDNSRNNCLCGESKYYGACSGDVYNREAYVVNGADAKQGEYPWQVALTLCADRKTCFACGGTIVNHKYVITAMHCIKNPFNGGYIPTSGITVSVGEHDKHSYYGPAFYKKVGVVRLIKRNDYSSRSHNNDIAILELSEWLTFNRDVRPACLPSPYKDYAGKRAVVTGWGATSWDGDSSSVLQKVGLWILGNNDRKCVKGAMGHGRAPGSEKMCAYNDYRDSCQGDSGGPLVVEDNGRCTLVGVVSYGHKCATPNYAGVYARVSNYLDWIYTQTYDGGCYTSY